MSCDRVSYLKFAEAGQIVVSDAEAILGIGDQVRDSGQSKTDDKGSGGIGISSAKAVIYTLAAGVE